LFIRQVSERDQLFATLLELQRAHSDEVGLPDGSLAPSFQK
jgi:hypothetical protein